MSQTPEQDLSGVSETLLVIVTYFGLAAAP